MTLPYPFRLLVSLAQLVRQNAYMIRAMVVRDMRARYVGSFLGFFWSVLHPLTQLAIYYFVIAVVMKMRLGPEYGGVNYALWLVAGLLPWMLFAEAVTRSPNAVIDQSSLVKKMPFPSELFPIANLTAAIVNHLIALTILFAVLALVGQTFSLKILWFLPYLAATSLFILGVTWCLSAISVFLRDIGQIISVLVNIWFFLTPVIYPQDLIPANLRWLFALNPMLYVVEGYRAAIFGTSAVDMVGVAYLLVVAVAIFAVGGLTFKRLKPAFADVL